ncbi:MAG: tRNA epoxyqueuosine(34) reductase QueG [Chloroflexi bacterium]|nr:tRNA epoxyqueuosine(34) reductase QueG [Chloroflexota bacterium]
MALARRLGFDLAGVTTAEPLPEADVALQAALAEGRLEVLPWMRAERVFLATHPQELFLPARSILSVGMSYLSDSPAARPPGPAGRVARYAWGDDYHTVLRERLRDLRRAVEAMVGRPLAAKICVDTAPLAERAIAVRAGLGWQGKNATLLSPGLGSWLVLGEVLWDLELAPDGPYRGSCGDCDLCLRACPTGALATPHTLDVGRCLAYLTIEHRGEIPPRLRSFVGDRLFGCDVCQEVCPHNAIARAPNHRAFRPQHGPWLALRPLLALTDAELAARFGKSSLRRAGVEGLRRNARIVWGNLHPSGQVRPVGPNPA